MDHLGSVGALARPTLGFYARPQISLARTRAVGPRVRDLYVGVAPDLCISGRCPTEYALGHESKFPPQNLDLRASSFSLLDIPSMTRVAQFSNCVETRYGLRHPVPQSRLFKGVAPPWVRRRVGMPIFWLLCSSPDTPRSHPGCGATGARPISRRQKGFCALRDVVRVCRRQLIESPPMKS